MATGMHQHCDCARFLFHGASQLSVAHLVCLAGMEVLSNKTMRTRGSVRKHGSAWRAQVQLAGASVNGPTRQSKTLAKTDLEAARAASSNDEMRDKLEKLRKTLASHEHGVLWQSPRRYANVCGRKPVPNVPSQGCQLKKGATVWRELHPNGQSWLRPLSCHGLGMWRWTFQFCITSGMAAR